MIGRKIKQTVKQTTLLGMGMTIVAFGVFLITSNVIWEGIAVVGIGCLVIGIAKWIE